MTLSERLIEVREYIEIVFLYVYFISLSLISLAHIFEKLFKKHKLNNASENTAFLLRAHTYITRVIVLGLLVAFPLLMYFNMTYKWGLSDAVVVSIPTVVLAMLIAEQNLYSYMSSRADLTNRELSALASVRQVVSSIYSDPEFKNKVPDEKSILMLEKSLERLEQRTREPNFAKFSTQAILTLDSIKTNKTIEIWGEFINRLHEDLKDESA
jgi:hypothetical protein